ncbi:MAG: hypothetical protein EON55_26415 [Alphaproteobacteria bacterium]|nr:MAG: hypothetical protein EON55_26415 [Alphaproteobacteria bacterium]
MTPFDPPVLAEKVSAVERHLARVAQKLPARPQDLRPSTDDTDVVILHLWQAIQIVIDMALSACVRLNLGAPGGYADAFTKLAAAGFLEASLSDRLFQASGLRTGQLQRPDSRRR